jgi:hypothetical protein
MNWRNPATVKQRRSIMKKPTHRAYVVVEPKQGSERKAKWVEVGAIWPHKSGSGFDVVIEPGISLSGRIVCTEPKKDDAAA